MERAVDTGWRIFAGKYGRNQGFQIVPTPEKPIMWQGSEPPTNKADGHIYAIFRTRLTIELHLLFRKDGLACGGIPVGAPDIHMMFHPDPEFTMLTIQMRLRSQ